MNKNIILAGVGGQGILTLAAVIDRAAMLSGLNIKQAEVHGMSQRGGEVQSHLRISNRTIYSDLIPREKADLIVSLEPLESLRYLPYLSAGGMIITAIEPVKNITSYPSEEQLYDQIKDSGHQHLFVDAGKLAREAGSAKTENVVMVGVAARFIGIEKQKFEESLREMFGSKGEAIIGMNMNAFNLGYELAGNS